MKKLEADITCPGCGHKFKQKLEGMRPGQTRTCPRCRETIRFTGDDASAVQRAVDDLEKEFKKFGNL